jgi:RNA polymerase sigma-70 factor, ECF subfamily
VRLIGVERGAGQFEELVRPQIEPAFRLARVMLSSHADAEDAVQEAMALAWRRLHQLRDPAAFRPWFLAIVVSRCRTARRSRWSLVLRLDDAEERLAGPESDDVVGHLDLRGALRRLSAADRAALLLFYVLDLPLEEVAAALGLSRGAAKTRIYRAAARLRLELTEEVRL